MNKLEFGIHSFSWSEIPHWMKVGNYSSIGADCFFHGNDNHYCIENPNCVTTTDIFPCKGKGNIEIGNDVWLGHGVEVLEGVKIGNGAIIGAGTLVRSNVPPFAVVVGNPQYRVRFRFNPSQIEKLEEIAWWNWSEGLFNERREDFKDVDKFIRKYL